LHGAHKYRINFALTWLACRGKSHADFLLTTSEGQVVKPEWGVKRTCHSCGAKFYDLKRDPIVCPKCGTTFDFETALKSRKVRTVAEAKPVPAKAKAKARPVKDEDTDALEDIEDVEDVEDVGDDDVLAEDDDTDDTLEDVVVTGTKRVAPDDEDEDEDIDLDLDDDEEEALLIDDEEEDSLDEVEEEIDEDEDGDEKPRGR
jgi:uncharacterized protein (TIGR02300 family)